MKLIKRFIYLFTEYSGKAFTGKFSFFAKDEVLSEIDNDIAHSLKLRVRSRQNSSKHSPINSVSQSTEFMKGFNFSKNKLKNVGQSMILQQSMNFQSDINPDPYKTDFEKLDFKELVRKRNLRKNNSDLQQVAKDQNFPQLNQVIFKRLNDDKPTLDFILKNEKKKQKGGSGSFNLNTGVITEELQIFEDEESGDKKPRKVQSPRFAIEPSNMKEKKKDKKTKFHQKKKSLPIEKDKGWHFKKKLISKHNRTVSCGAEGNILFSIGNPEKPLDRKKNRRSFGVKKKSNSLLSFFKYSFILDSEGFRGFQAAILEQRSGDEEKDNKKIIIEKLQLSDDQTNSPEFPLPEETKQVNQMMKKYEKRDKPIYKKQPSQLQKDFNSIRCFSLIKDVLPIRTISFSPNGDYFAIGTNSKMIKIFSLQQFINQSAQNQKHTNFGLSQIPMIYQKKDHHFGSIYAMDWSSDGNFIATGSNDKSIKLLGVQNLNTMSDDVLDYRMVGHKAIVRSVIFSNDVKHLFSCGSDDFIGVWNLEKGDLERKFEGHQSSILSLKVNGDDNLLVSVGKDQTMRLWDLRAWKAQKINKLQNLAPCTYLSICNTKESMNMSYILRNSKTGLNNSLSESLVSQKIRERIGFVSHQDGKISQWDIIQGQMMNIFDIHNQECRAMDIDPTCNYLLTGGFDKNLYIYDIDEDNIQKKIQVHTNKIVHVKWHPFFPIFASSSADTTVRLFTNTQFCDKYRMKPLQEF